MNMMVMTADSLSKQVNAPVPEIYVTIAKNSIVGLDSASIAELLGCERTEVDQVLDDQVYKDIRLLMAAEYARGKIDADFSWDSLEQQALKNLSKRMHLEQDPDFNLRVAVMANKAQRRMTDSGPKVLDPSQGGARVPLNLTSRIVKRLNAKTGDASIEVTRSVSVTDGTAVNPTFEDIDHMFGVSARPMVVENATARTTDAEFSVEDMAESFLANRR